MLYLFFSFLGACVGACVLVYTSTIIELRRNNSRKLDGADQAIMSFQLGAAIFGLFFMGMVFAPDPDYVPVPVSQETYEIVSVVEDGDEVILVVKGEENPLHVPKKDMEVNTTSTVSYVEVTTLEKTNWWWSPKGEDQRLEYSLYLKEG